MKLTTCPNVTTITKKSAIKGRKKKRHHRAAPLMGNQAVNASLKTILDLVHLYDIQAEAEYGKTNNAKCRTLQSLCKIGTDSYAFERLRADGEKYLPIYKSFIAAVAISLQSHFKAPSAAPLIASTIKGVKRSLGKICEYSKDPLSYGVRDLKDLVRATIYVNTEAELCAVVGMFNRGDTFKYGAPGVFQGPGGSRGKPVVPEPAGWEGPTKEELYAKIVSVKNRFQTPSDGYRDVNLLLHLSQPDDLHGHIAELQVHMRPIIVTKAMWHVVYEFTRVIEESLKALVIYALNNVDQLIKQIGIVSLIEPLVKAAKGEGDWSTLSQDDKALLGDLPTDCKSMMLELGSDEDYLGPMPGNSTGDFVESKIVDAETLWKSYQAAKKAMKKAYDDTYKMHSSGTGCAAKKTFSVAKRIAKGIPCKTTSCCKG